MSLISPRKEAAIANALAAAAAAAVAGGSAHGNATPAAVVAAATPTATRPGGRAAVFAIGEHLRCGNRKCRPWIRPCTQLAPLSPPPWRPLQLPTLPPPLPLPPRSPQPPATASRPSNCRSGAHDGALELPQRCPRWRPQIAAAVPTMAPVGSTETSMRGLPISAPISPPQGKPRVVAPAAATPLAAVVAVKGVGHLPLRDDLSAPAAAASAALDASSEALGSGSRAAAAPQRAAAAPIDPVRQRVRQSGTCWPALVAAPVAADSVCQQLSCVQLSCWTCSLMLADAACETARVRCQSLSSSVNPYR